MGGVTKHGEDLIALIEGARKEARRTRHEEIMEEHVALVVGAGVLTKHLLRAAAFVAAVEARLEGARAAVGYRDVVVVRDGLDALYARAAAQRKWSRWLQPLSAEDVVDALLGESGPLSAELTSARFDTDAVRRFAARASEEASRRGHRNVIAEHALVGACDAPFFRAPLEAAGVDVDALGRALDGMLTSRRFASAKLGAVETLVQLACLHANIIGADAPSLGRLIVDLLRNPHVTRSLAARGFVAYDLLFSFVHREPPDPRNEAVGGRAELVLHDDPFSTMEHVVKVLRDVFALSEAESQKTMLAVHEGGSASLGTFDVEEATRRRDAVRATSRVAGMPLRVVLRASP